MPRLRVLSRLLLLPALLAVCTAVALEPDAIPEQADLGRLETLLGGVLAENPDVSDPVYRTNVPLALLQLRKARMVSGRGGQADRLYISEALSALRRFADRERYAPEPDRLVEMAYVAGNDGTAQPYYVFLPRTYDPEREEPWPLMVFLHGYVPSISILQPWVLDVETCRIAADLGCILLIPYGRRNTDFQGVGETDVLAGIREVRELFPVDPDRIYLSGVSMGGMGTWNLALRHPGLFAAATPITGQTDMHAWWPRLLPDWPLDRDDLWPFRRMLVEWDNPIDLVRNARNQKLFVQHGENDLLIPVKQSLDMVAAAHALGIPIRVHVFPGASHYIYWDRPCFENAWGWAVQQHLDRSPAHVTYKTYSLEYDTAFWARILAFVRWGREAVLDCRVADDGVLHIDTVNVADVRIDTEPAPLPEPGPDGYAVRVNGEARSVVPSVDGSLTIAVEPGAGVVPGGDTWLPRKRKGLCGPVEEVFDGPFLVVPGTGGAGADQERVRRNAMTWIQEWDRFADGIPRIRVDSELTTAEIRAHNLVLFGGPETNSVVAAIAPRLPLRLGEESFGLGDESWTGRNLGAVLCYPNPLAPDRYVLIYAGELYGRNCGINHKHDLLPDFLVFRSDAFSFDETNEHLAAGYFDVDWQPAEDLTWTRSQDALQAPAAP